MENSRTVWSRMERILSRGGGGARQRMSVFFFKAVVHSVLLFGADTCVVTPCMVRVLGSYQYQVARQLTGCLPRRWEYGNLEYTLAEVARVEAVFETMETYIRKIQNTSTQYIATQSILGLCEATERKQGEWVGIRWWEQEGIDMTGAK